MVIRHKINRRYRGGHPRTYLPGLAGFYVGANGNWTAASMSATLTGWNTFMASCIASPPAAVGTLVHVNVSYFTGFVNKMFPSGRQHPVPTVRGTPVVDTIVSESINPRPASQRRRNIQSA
jgi:hypothetical protein